MAVARKRPERAYRFHTFFRVYEAANLFFSEQGLLSLSIQKELDKEVSFHIDVLTVLAVHACALTYS